MFSGATWIGVAGLDETSKRFTRSNFCQRLSEVLSQGLRHSAQDSPSYDAEAIYYSRP
jgi:hypothetical protein